MNWKAYEFQDFAIPLMGRRGGLLDWRRMARGAGRRARGMMRGGRRRKSRSFFCCCPVFLALGVAALGAVGGLLYMGVRFLGWA
jgi:hypothetical protein